VTVEFASTLNDEKILQDRKMKIEKGRKTHPSAISKADKLAKFANDLGLKPDDVLGKRDPKAADDGNEQAKEKGESDDASKGREESEGRT
jgi:hypothetical protein